MPVAQPTDFRVPQTAAYQSSPYQGAPQPAYQAPGADAASGLNQALAGTGASISAQQAAGAPPGAISLLEGITGNITGPAQEALAGQTGLLTGPGGQQDLASQGLALQRALTSQEAGFSLDQLGVQGSNLAIQRALLGQTAGPGGFQEQQRNLTAAEEAQQFAQNKRGLYGQAAASGSTGGNQVTQWSDLLKNYGFQQQQLALQGKEQQAQYAASSAQLGNAAKSLGISQQEVVARLNNALASFGLQGKMDANSIAQQVAALQQGFLSGAQASSLQMLLSAAGIPLMSLMGGT